MNGTATHYAAGVVLPDGRVLAAYTEPADGGGGWLRMVTPLYDARGDLVGVRAGREQPTGGLGAYVDDDGRLVGRAVNRKALAYMDTGDDGRSRVAVAYELGASARLRLVAAAAAEGGDDLAHAVRFGEQVSAWCASPLAVTDDETDLLRVLVVYSTAAPAARLYACTVAAGRVQYTLRSSAPAVELSGTPVECFDVSTFGVHFAVVHVTDGRLHATFGHVLGDALIVTARVATGELARPPIAACWRRQGERHVDLAVDRAARQLRIADVPCAPVMVRAGGVFTFSCAFRLWLTRADGAVLPASVEDAVTGRRTRLVEGNGTRYVVLHVPRDGLSAPVIYSATDDDDDGALYAGGLVTAAPPAAASYVENELLVAFAGAHAPSWQPHAWGTLAASGGDGDVAIYRQPAPLVRLVHVPVGTSGVGRTVSRAHGPRPCAGAPDAAAVGVGALPAVVLSEGSAWLHDEHAGRWLCAGPAPTAVGASCLPRGGGVEWSGVHGGRRGGRRGECGRGRGGQCAGRVGGGDAAADAAAQRDRLRELPRCGRRRRAVDGPVDGVGRVGRRERAPGAAEQRGHRRRRHVHAARGTERCGRRLLRVVARRVRLPGPRPRREIGGGGVARGGRGSRCPRARALRPLEWQLVGLTFAAAGGEVMLRVRNQAAACALVVHASQVTLEELRVGGGVSADDTLKVTFFAASGETLEQCERSVPAVPEPTSTDVLDRFDCLSYDAAMVDTLFLLRAVDGRRDDACAPFSAGAVEDAEGPVGAPHTLVRHGARPAGVVREGSWPRLLSADGGAVRADAHALDAGAPRSRSRARRRAAWASVVCSTSRSRAGAGRRRSPCATLAVDFATGGAPTPSTAARAARQPRRPRGPAWRRGRRGGGCRSRRTAARRPHAGAAGRMHALRARWRVGTRAGASPSTCERPRSIRPRRA